MEHEELKCIPGYEDRYAVTKSGDVYSVNCNKRGDIRKRKLVSNKFGYLTCILCKNGKPKCFMVHRLVAITFLGIPDDKNEVNHKDGNKQNNRLENLEWVTHTENMQHAVKIGLLNPNNFSAPMRLSDYVLGEIKERLRGFESDVEIALSLDLHPTTISKYRKKFEAEIFS